MGTQANNGKDYLQILENSINNPNVDEQQNFRIEYNINKFNKTEIDEEKFLFNPKNSWIENEDSSNDSFSNSFELVKELELDNPKYDIKNLNKFPYNAIGTITVKIPISDKFLNIHVF